MRLYIVSLGAGLPVGIIYSLLNVRSHRQCNPTATPKAGART